MIKQFGREKRYDGDSDVRDTSALAFVPPLSGADAETTSPIVVVVTPLAECSVWLP